MQVFFFTVHHVNWSVSLMSGSVIDWTDYPVLTAISRLTLQGIGLLSFKWYSSSHSLPSL